MFLLLRDKQNKLMYVGSTVLPAKSNSGVMFCLQSH